MSTQMGVVGFADSGKSTFVAANVSGKTLVFDSDNRWGDVAPLAEGATFELAPRRAITNPLEMFDELDRAADSGVTTVIYDSVTKIYSHFARRASMTGRLDRKEREKRGLGKAKYTDMIDKADVMQVMANTPTYGVDVFFIWHRGSGLNVGGKVEGFKEYELVSIDQVSAKELETLKASMSMIVAFSASPAGYFATVEYARARGRRAPRTGFTIADYPGNFWRGGLERLEDLIYRHFSGQEDALRWVAEMLGGSPDDYLDLYVDIKDRRSPKSASMMWFYIVDEVYDILHRRESEEEAVREERKLEVQAPPAPEPTPAPEPAPEPEPETEGPPPEVSAEDLFGALESEEKADPGPVFGDGTIVPAEALPFYEKYQKAYGNIPPNINDLRNAVKVEKWT
jgi:hypothetical protein